MLQSMPSNFNPHPTPHPTPCRRTFKYLMGVLSAKWVVREDWLAACLAQQGPADERGFLVRPPGWPAAWELHASSKRACGRGALCLRGWPPCVHPACRVKPWLRVGRGAALCRPACTVPGVPHPPAHPAPNRQVERDHGGGAGGPAAAISSHQLGLPALLHGYEVFLAGKKIKSFVLKRNS